MKTNIAYFIVITLIFMGCSKKQISKTNDSTSRSVKEQVQAPVTASPVQPKISMGQAKPSTPLPTEPIPTTPPSTAKPPTATKPAMSKPTGNAPKYDEALLYEEEVHLSNVKQLSFGGDNAEAYFSTDDKQVVLQKKRPEEGYDCDQIFYADLPESDAPALFPLKMRLVSTGKGRTTCSFFMPGNEEIIYSSTHLSADECPPAPADIGKYVWPIYDSFEIFLADKNGNITKQFTDNNFYDAEPTVSPDGKMIVFTSNRTGDLELYTMNVDGSNIKQVTYGLGYDGGAFFSPDSKKLIFRASRPETPEAIAEYKSLLSQGLVAPTEMELFVCNVDGSDLRQITDLGKANWAPYFHPSGEKVIFSSNHESERGFPFNLYMINLDGTGLKKITNGDTFDAFPMFSYDGKKLLFSSNRNNGGTRDTNVFIADWIENPEE